MNYNPEIHHRRSIRLKGHDYSKAGAYFITANVKDMACLFGKIVDDKMILNDIGTIANEYLQGIPKHFSNVKMGEFIVMPNHVHCILELHKLPTVETSYMMSPDNSKNESVGTRHVVSLQNTPSNDTGTSCMMSTPPNPPDKQTPRHNQFSKPVPGSISVIFQQYKSSVKRWCNDNSHEYFQWQSRFHDRIIRGEQSYQNIINYIKNNSKNWKADKFYMP